MKRKIIIRIKGRKDLVGKITIRNKEHFQTQLTYKHTVQRLKNRFNRKKKHKNKLDDYI